MARHPPTPETSHHLFASPANSEIQYQPQSDVNLERFQSSPVAMPQLFSETGERVIMRASYVNRLNCQSAMRPPMVCIYSAAIFILSIAINYSAGAAEQPRTEPTPAPGTAGAATTAPQPAAETPAPQTEMPTESPWAFQSFSAADGVYVLDTATGLIRVIGADGRTYTYVFNDQEPPPAPGLLPAAAPTAGRYQGNLVKGVLYVLDRKTGMMMSLSAATLVKKIVLIEGGQPVRPEAAPPGVNPATGSAVGATHLPPPPVYTPVLVPKELSDTDRAKSERDIDDYSGSIGYPYMGKPGADGYELALAIENRGKRTLAALETTVEYTDPKTGKVVQQRLYFRRDNGATNAPPAPGKDQKLTIRLPNLDTQPVIRVYTSYLLYGD